MISFTSKIVGRQGAGPEFRRRPCYSPIFRALGLLSVANILTAANAMATCNSLRTDTQDFFSDKDPDITEATKAIFVQYSGIPEEQVVPHIRAVVRLTVHALLLRPIDLY